MEKIEVFIEFASIKLAEITGLSETLSFLIVLLTCGFIIIRILKWLFGDNGNQGKTYENPKPQIPDSQLRQKQKQEEERREKERQEHIRKERERAAEVARLEILDGRRRKEGW